MQREDGSCEWNVSRQSKLIHAYDSCLLKKKLTLSCFHVQGMDLGPAVSLTDAGLGWKVL